MVLMSLRKLQKQNDNGPSCISGRIESGEIVYSSVCSVWFRPSGHFLGLSRPLETRRTVNVGMMKRQSYHHTKIMEIPTSKSVAQSIQTDVTSTSCDSRKSQMRQERSAEYSIDQNEPTQQNQHFWSHYTDRLNRQCVPIATSVG
jgi:hypothetical protein